MNVIEGDYQVIEELPKKAEPVHYGMFCEAGNYKVELMPVPVQEVKLDLSRCV